MNIIIESKIHTVRGQKIMIDKDLAELYQVKTKRLNEQVKRNIEKFPSDFMFELTNDEKDKLIAKCDKLKSLKFNPSSVKAFTEQGVYMLATILKSKIGFIDD